MPFLAAIIPAATLGAVAGEGAAVAGGTLLAGAITQGLSGGGHQQQIFDPTDILDDDGGSSFP